MIEKREDKGENFICLYKTLRREGRKRREGRQGIELVFHILLDEFLNLCENSFSTC